MYARTKTGRKNQTYQVNCFVAPLHWFTSFLLFFSCSTSFLLFFTSCTTSFLLFFTSCTTSFLLFFTSCTTSFLLFFTSCTTSFLLFFTLCFTQVFALHFSFFAWASKKKVKNSSRN